MADAQSSQSSKSNGGGFCRFGNFVWFDEGHREQVINLDLIEAATLKKDNFPNPEKPWHIHVATNASGYGFDFATEHEARKFLAIVVRDDESQQDQTLGESK